MHACHPALGKLRQNKFKGNLGHMINRLNETKINLSTLNTWLIRKEVNLYFYIRILLASHKALKSLWKWTVMQREDSTFITIPRSLVLFCLLWNETFRLFTLGEENINDTTKFEYCEFTSEVYKRSWIELENTTPGWSVCLECWRSSVARKDV